MSDILDQLRRNAEDREALIEERDRLIRQAKAERWPVVDIAEAVGLSRQHVHKIIAESPSGG